MNNQFIFMKYVTFIVTILVLVTLVIVFTKPSEVKETDTTTTKTRLTKPTYLICNNIGDVKTENNKVYTCIHNVWTYTGMVDDLKG